MNSPIAEELLALFLGIAAVLAATALLAFAASTLAGGL